MKGWTERAGWGGSQADGIAGCEGGGRSGQHAVEADNAQRLDVGQENMGMTAVRKGICCGTINML